MSEQFFTVTQIAKHFKKSRAAVHLWIQNGELIADEVGGRYLIKKTSLEAFAKERVYDISGLISCDVEHGRATPCMVRN